MTQLNTGMFQNVASSMVKVKDEEFCCTICLVTFGNEDDVTELECDRRHLFHTECLRPWLETNLSCPICRTEVTVN